MVRLYSLINYWGILDTYSGLPSGVLRFKKYLSKHTYFARVCDIMMVIMILKSYSDAVLVPMSPG